MNLAEVTFSIITPSRNRLLFLKRAYASVADQGGVKVEHIIVDGLSEDGTGEWLRSVPGVRPVVEPDSGMYEAINKGLDRSTGEIVGFLNTDEQYLPGALSAVAAYFRTHPETDILFGHFLVVAPDGSLICFRKGFVPRSAYVRTSHLYTLTCTMFLRRRILDDGHRFDAMFKASGDEELVVRLIGRYGVGYLERYLAVYTEHPGALSRTATARAETLLLRLRNPFWLNALSLPLLAFRYVEKLIRGAYRERMPFSYALYTGEDLTGRREFTVRDATFRWRLPGH